MISFSFSTATFAWWGVWRTRPAHVSSPATTRDLTAIFTVLLLSAAGGTPLKQMPHSNSPAAVTPPGTLIKGASVTPGGRLRVATPARRAAERESGDVVLEKVGPGRLRVCTPLKAL